MVILLLFYLLAPAGVIWLCRKVKFLDKIGAVLILYILGATAANLSIMPEGSETLQTILSSVTIPLAIPMLLMTANFRNISLKKSLLTLFLAMVAVIITVVVGFLIFKDRIGGLEEPYKIGAMLTGVYTGGTANMAAIKMMVGASEESYIALNIMDMIASFFYIIFLLSVGIKIFRKLLPFHKSKPVNETGLAGDNPEVYTDMETFYGILKWKNFRQVLISAGVSVIIAAVSATLAVWVSGGLSQGLDKLLGGSTFMTVIMLSITTLAIGASFIKPIQKQSKSYDGCMYLVYIFSIVVASMADLSKMNIGNELYTLMYIFFVIFVSLALHTLLARIFKIDGDTMAISSVAIINSPPFVPMIASAMKNKDALVIGLSVGIAGYAISNYLGYLVGMLLRML